MRFGPPPIELDKITCQLKPCSNHARYIRSDGTWTCGIHALGYHAVKVSDLGALVFAGGITGWIRALVGVPELEPEAAERFRELVSKP